MGENDKAVIYEMKWLIDWELSKEEDFRDLEALKSARIILDIFSPFPDKEDLEYRYKPQ